MCGITHLLSSLTRWRGGNAGVCKTSMQGFDSPPCLQETPANSGTKQPYAGSNPTRASMEKEKSETKSKDETGFSEKQLDIDVETGKFKRKKVKKTLFE